MVVHNTQRQQDGTKQFWPPSCRWTDVLKFKCNPPPPPILANKTGQVQLRDLDIGMGGGGRGKGGERSSAFRSIDRGHFGTASFGAIVVWVIICVGW